LNFTLKPGQALQVTGANGSGKTTLLRILAGLYVDYWGQVSWQDSQSGQQAIDDSTRLAYLGHSAGVNKALTPMENLAWFALLAGYRFSQQRLLRTLAEVNLSDCGQLSAGQLRRLAIARLLLLAPPLWILDEPFTALDQQGVSWLEQVLAQHVNQGGLLIVTSHHPLTLPTVNLQRYALHD
jgi:heme exporter protein A